jgi:DNA primase
VDTQPSQTADRDAVKERVREATDIVDLVGSYLSLRRAGRNFTGLCPWHEDSRPSLQVNPERQTYRCWVCDIGGDVFNFLMRMERLEFREALEQLADRAGIDLPRGRGGPSSDDRQ